MSRPKNERGAAAVEFALLLPILLVILVAIMEFGYAFFIQASVAAAARDGVRSYAINYAAGTAKQTATALATAALPVPGDLQGVAFAPDCVPDGQTTMTITYRYRSLTGLLDGILGSSNGVIVTGVGSMQCGG